MVLLDTTSGPTPAQVRVDKVWSVNGLRVAFKSWINQELPQRYVVRIIVKSGVTTPLL